MSDDSLQTLSDTNSVRGLGELVVKHVQAIYRKFWGEEV